MKLRFFHFADFNEERCIETRSIYWLSAERSRPKLQETLFQILRLSNLTGAVPALRDWGNNSGLAAKYFGTKMAVLSFTLNPDAVSKFYDILVCLSKFSESVSIEASRDRLVLTALNSTKSAYACFTFAGSKFFARYAYTPHRVLGQQSKDKFSCKLYIKALIPVFKGRAVDPQREKDTNIERCEVAVEDDPEDIKSRFTIKMLCRHGVLKTYRLTFEAVTTMHALFKQDLVKNRWTISSRTLRELVEHFEPKTEQLDIYYENNRANFMSYTEKITAGNAILKQPLQTTIAIDTQEFIEFAVEEKLHIVISVKDFKAIVTHAGISNTDVAAAYSHPFSPMQLKYHDEGITCEFILMTIGDARGSSATPGPGISRSNLIRPTIRQTLDAASNRSVPASASSMPPPPRSAAPSISRESTRARLPRPSPPPPQPSFQSSALFVPEDDDDRRWNPAYEEDEEMLGWDASANKDISGPTLNRSGQSLQSHHQTNTERAWKTDESTQHLSPTQRISQIRGIFDD